MANLLQIIKKELWRKFQVNSTNAINANGYVLTPEHNLVPTVKLSDFQYDLQQGSGSELVSKFLAVHSSSALAVNTFAIWKDKAQELSLCGVEGFKQISFEKKCSTGLGGTSPNLDVLAESDTVAVGIESKLLEPLSRKRPKFSESYSKSKLPYIEEKWWRILEDKRKGELQYLDVAQLIKHYLGLRNQYRNRTVILFYLFWEPTNWQQLDIFVKHREEIEVFAGQVKDTSVRFVAQSYPEL